MEMDEGSSCPSSRQPTLVINPRLNGIPLENIYILSKGSILAPLFKELDLV